MDFLSLYLPYSQYQAIINLTKEYLFIKEILGLLTKIYLKYQYFHQNIIDLHKIINYFPNFDKFHH